MMRYWPDSWEIRLLARIVPGKTGRPGKNVLGYDIQPAAPAPCGIHAGKGVTRNGNEFLANAVGIPVLKNNTTLLVEPVDKGRAVRFANRNINCDTKDSYTAEDLEINGAVRRGAFLTCRSLVLNGPLAGSVACTGDMDVNGEIGGEGQERPGDAETPGFEADITCHGRFRATRAIKNSRIHVAGFFSGARTTVSGSEIYTGSGMALGDALTGSRGPCRLRAGLQPGDRLIELDNALDAKRRELSALQKEDEIEKLEVQYQEDMAAEKALLAEQSVVRNLITVMEAPELHQADDLQGKIRFLESLPDHSSVKACYLNVPKTGRALSVYQNLRALAEKKSPGDYLECLKKQAGPAPEGTGTHGRFDLIKVQFQQGLAVLEEAVDERSEDIEQLNRYIRRLEAARKKMAAARRPLPGQSPTGIHIKGRCDKGTVIMGVSARYVVPRTLYQVRFREVLAPGTGEASIRVG